MQEGKLFVAALVLSVLLIGNEAIPTGFIINGQIAPPTPHHVYVLYLNAQGAGLFGGGSLITLRHVLTSGQCISGYVRWEMGLGSNVFTHLTQVISTQAMVHPNYNSNTRTNDIGIITLPRSLTATANIAPIAMAPIGINNLPMLNEQGAVVGFGGTSANVNRADLLHMAFKRVIADNVCQQNFQVTVPNHFCAIDQTNRGNICWSDVGGGFTTMYQRREILVGISSMVIEGCGHTFPSAYTRIAPYAVWIQNNTMFEN